MTLGELLTKYYYEHVAGLSSQSRNQLNHSSRFWHQTGLADVDVRDLTAIEIGDALLRGRFEASWNDSKLYFTALAPLRSAWRWAQKKDYLNLPFPGERIYHYWYKKIVKNGARRMLPKPPVSIVSRAVTGQRVV
jgi:hypothetical protein